MKATLVALLAVLVVASAVTVHDMEMFEEGFLIGLEIEVGNSTNCIKDEQRMAKDLTTAFADIKTGIHKLNIPMITKGFAELADAINVFGNEMVDCGAEELEDDIKEIIAELKSPHGIVKLIEDEAIVMFFHGKEITKDVKSMIADWEAHSYKASGKDLGELCGILIEKKL